MAPKDPHPDMYAPAQSSPLEWAGLGDSLLTKRIQQKWCYLTLEIGLQKACCFHFGHFPQISHSEEHSWRVVNNSGEKPTWMSVKADPSGTVKPGQKLDYNRMRDPDSETPNEAGPRFLAYRNCEIRNVCSFKMLNFRESFSNRLLIHCFSQLLHLYAGPWLPLAKLHC